MNQSKKTLSSLAELRAKNVTQKLGSSEFSFEVFEDKQPDLFRINVFKNDSWLRTFTTQKKYWDDEEIRQKLIQRFFQQHLENLNHSSKRILGGEGQKYVQ